MTNIKELKIISDGSPAGTHVFINGVEIGVMAISFETAVDDILVNLNITPAFEYEFESIKE